MHSLSGGRDEDDREIGEVAMLADGRTADPTYQAQRGMLRDLISRGLSRADRLILLLYYYEGLNMAQVGRALGLSESRVSQKHKRIVKDLRSRLIGRSNDFEASLAA
jgi:RNA polymerase sigma factor for flagellar operon FliA